MNIDPNWQSSVTQGPARRPAAGKPDRIVAALDVGSSKVCAIVARIHEDGRIHVLGLGHRVSRGMRKGAITDLAATEAAIRAAVDQAERVAGETVEDIVVSLSAGEPTSDIMELDVSIAGHAVDEADIREVLQRACGKIATDERHVLHAFPACYAVDEAVGVRDPIGMYGERLSVAIHIITAREGPIRNLETCIGRAHLVPETFVAAPYASGLATLVEDEMRLGAACVDIGGGNTGISVFAGGAMVYGAVLPGGGQDITENIAREMLTPLDQAERIKILHGAAVQSRSDANALIEVLRVGENDRDEESYVRLPRAMLTGVVQPQMEAILEGVAVKLDEAGFTGSAGKRVVLTGGASQLPGLRELAQRVLGRHVRLAHPRGLIGLPESASGPAFATTAGLLAYLARAPRELGETNAKKTKDQSEFWGRVGAWLRENL